MKSKKLVSLMMFICLLIFLINGISEKEEVVFFTNASKSVEVDPVWPSSNSEKVLFADPVWPSSNSNGNFL